MHVVFVSSGGDGGGGDGGGVGGCGEGGGWWCLWVGRRRCWRWS